MSLFCSNRWLILVNQYGVILSLLVLTAACDLNIQAQAQDSTSETQTQVKQSRQVVASSSNRNISSQRGSN
jgi:hypothetical protein